MIRSHGRFLLSCLLAFTAGHMFNYTVILYLQEAVGSDLLSGLGFGLAFGSSIVFGWFGGVLCDRAAPGRVIHGAQALFLVGLACLWWADTGAATVDGPSTASAAIVSLGTVIEAIKESRSRREGRRRL